jgi:VacB/RNase II family 3'-5' exoribonuclease
VRPPGWKPIDSTRTNGVGATTPIVPQRNNSGTTETSERVPLVGGRPAPTAKPNDLGAQLNAIAYAAKDEATQRILREAAEAAEGDAKSPWISLRSKGPGTLPQTVSGTIHREIDHGNPVIVFTPDDKAVPRFRLSPADLQGVADHGHVTIKRFGSGKNQKLEIDARDATKVQSFIGVVEQRGKQLVAVSLDPLAPIRDLPLPGAKADLVGKTVLTHVVEPLSQKRFGLAEEILPDRDGWKTNFLDLATRHGVEATFSPEVKKDVAKIKELFDPEKIQGYEDFTDKPFFAVDNPYSKDFDQAMHLEPSKAHPGATDVYYAIADVGYFFNLLGKNSAVEQRASRIQTTTYLPGVDAPVLDRSLSEDLISLGAGEKRPAFVIKFTVAADGEMVGEPTFHDGVVKNRVNTNYPAVQSHYDGKKAIGDPELTKGIELLREVGGKLLEKAKARGMVTSSEGETWATIDDKTGELKRERRGMLWVEEANAQISITANNLIGKYLIENDAPAFHRVHPEPDPARLASAQAALKSLGIEWPQGAKPSEVLAKLDPKHPKWRIARRLLLRAMPRAVVSAEPSPHAGLKLAEYVQSTAPMRRERDRRNHDFVRSVRDNQKPATEDMNQIVEHALAAQNRDIMLQRSVRDRLAAHALQDFQGKPVAAEVIGVSPHGIDVFVPGADTELFIPMKRFGELMKLDKGGLSLRSADGKTNIGLGDAIEIVVRSADAKKGVIDAVPRSAVTAATKPVAAFAKSGGGVPLASVRGDGFTSPYVGQTVTTKGVVTALNGIGFYIQPIGANSIDESGGVLVRTRGAAVAPGDVVSVRGVVRESRGKDAIYDRSIVEISNRPEVDILEAGKEIPKPVLIGEGGLPPPPADRSAAIEYWRKLLGQRIKIKSGTAISPSNRFNDLVVLPDGWSVEEKRKTHHGGVLLKDEQENMIKVSIKAREHVGGLPPTSVGDRLEDIEGIVTYRSGDFQVELSKPTKVTHAPRPELEPTKLVGTDEQLTIASVNTLNLHQGEAQRAKRIAERIVFDLGSPDIVALQEIQDNDGPTKSLVVEADETYQMLIDRIKAAGGPAYAWVDLPPELDKDGGQPGGNIRTGYLYRPDRVGLVDGSAKRIGVGVEAFDSTRKSLLVKFEFDGHELALVNNHLSSRRGSTPWNADVDELIIGNAEKRVAQAEEVNAVIADLKKKDPKCDVLVVGDFNDFPSSKTLQAVAKDGFSNLTMLVPEEERFDYNYRGTLQTLTSVVGNQNLVDEGRVELEYMHHNSLNPLDDSDHDHVVVRLKKPAA